MVQTAYTPNIADIDYRAGLQGVNNGKQFADIYYPHGGLAPAGGFRALFYFNSSGLTISGRDGIASVDDGHDLLRYYCLTRGFVLIDVELTMTDVGGAPVGGGMWRDPLTDVQYNLDGGGDDQWSIDAKMVVQHFRYHYKQYGLNPYRFASAGNSAGAICAQACALDFDAKDISNPIAKRRVSSRVQALVELKINAWFHGTVRDSGVGGVDTVNTFLRRASNPDQLATDGEDALPAHVLHASPNWYMMQPAARARNTRLPCYIWTNAEPGTLLGKEVIEPPNLSFDLDVNHVPVYEADSFGGLVDRHDAFGGMMRMKALRALSAWHDEHSLLVATETYTVGGVTPDQIISDQHTAAAHQADWLNDLLPETAQPSGPSGPFKSITAGAMMVQADGEIAAYPLETPGTGTDDPAASVGVGHRMRPLGIYVDSIAGEAPAVTVVDELGSEVYTEHFPAGSASRANEIINVQRGVLDYGAVAGGGGDVATATIDAVVTAKTIPYLTNFRRSNAGRSTPDAVALVNDDVGERTLMVNTTTVGFARYANGENVDHRLAWEAREMLTGTGDPDEIIVRAQAEVTMAAAAGSFTTGAIGTIVDVTRCTVEITSVANDRNAGGYDSVNVTGVVNGDKTVTVTRGDTTDEWKGIVCVKEYSGSNYIVRSWSHTFTVGSVRQSVALSGSIPSFANAIIIGNMRSTAAHTDNDESGMIVLPPLSGTTTIDAAIPVGADDIGAGAYIAQGWVVYNPTWSVIHDNNFDGSLAGFAGGTQTQDYTIPGGVTVDLARTFIMGSSISTGALPNYPQPNVNFRLKTDTSFELWRGRSGSTITFAIQIAQLAAQVTYEEIPYGDFIDFSQRGMDWLEGPLGVRTNDPGTRAKLFFALA